MAEQVAGVVAERTAARELLGRIADDLLPGRDDEGDLLERDTQLELFRCAVNTACAELAEHSGPLVEALGVPEAALGDARAIEGA